MNKIVLFSKFRFKRYPIQQNIMTWILGLDILHATTKSQSYQLRIDLEDWNGNAAYAIYKYEHLS